MNSQSECPFCRENNLLNVPVIAEVADGFLITAQKQPGNFLIVPAVHTESLADLPDDWWRTVKALLLQVPAPLDHYNISVNIGEHAGQTIKHLHFWVVPRAAGKNASGKGLVTLVADANK